MRDPQKPPEHPKPKAKLCCRSCHGYGVISQYRAGVGKVCAICRGRGYEVVEQDVFTKRKETSLYQEIDISEEVISYTEFKIRF